MEKLKPAISKSSISSLRFQSKPDFDKFLKFIKKETKDLKDIETPKDGITKKVIGAGAAGLGLLGLSLLFKGKGTSSGDEGDDNFTFAVGREDDTQPRPPFVKTKPKAPRRFKKLNRQEGTRTFRKGKETKKTQARQQVKRKVRGKKIFKKQLVTQAIGDSAKKRKLLVRTQKRITEVTRGADYPGTRGKGFKYGPGDASFESGSVDLGNTERQFRNRGGRKINKKFGSDASINIPQSDYDVKKVKTLKKLIDSQLASTNLPSKIKRLNKRLQDMDRSSGGRVKSPKFKTTRPGVLNFSKFNPFKRFNVADNPMISKNTFKKGALSKIFNSKVTKDTFLKIPTKGKFFTKAGMFFNHPIPKGISFLLTAYDAYQEGKSIVNLKDNIFTAIYDLGVAVNNELFFPNDMSKHKLYITESSNDKIKAHKNDKNNAIKEFRNKVSSDGGGTKILIAPTDSGKNNTSSNNIPSTSGGDKVSFIPMEPLNIGEDILLYKLNA